MRSLLLAAAVTMACPALAASCDGADHRALDFWLGKWEVRSEGEVVAQSVIERSGEACAIAEHYKQADGYTGTSHSFYDGVLKKWRQTWIDSTGAIGEFTGEAKPGEMAFTGETHRADGRKVLRKMTLTAQPDGTVRQHSLASTDGGATWKPHYDFSYRRAAATASADGAYVASREAASWIAWKNRDGDFFEDFLSEDHVEVHGYGITGKKAVVEGVRSPACVVKSYSLGPMSETRVTEDTILLTYRAEQDTQCGDVKVPSPVFASSLYVRRGGRWLNVFYEHVATK